MQVLLIVLCLAQAPIAESTGEPRFEVTNFQTRLLWVGRFPYTCVFDLSFTVENFQEDDDEICLYIAGRDLFENSRHQFMRMVKVPPKTKKRFTFREFNHFYNYRDIRKWEACEHAIDLLPHD